MNLRYIYNSFDFITQSPILVLLELSGYYMTNAELAKLAVESKSKSLSPYSNFRVGSALLCADGTTYQGANIESPSYSLTI